MSVRIFLPADTVVDGDVPEPVAGAEISAMAVRLGGMWTPDGGDAFFEGVVEWSRHDEANRLFETVIVTPTLKALTQETAAARLPEPGTPLALRGTLSCVRTYEFDAFDLPDIRRGWRVLAVLSHDSNGYFIEAEPSPEPQLRP